MNKLMIPPNPNWFSQSIFYCTPDNGLVYGAMTKIVFIPPKSQIDSKEIKVVDLRNKLCCFSIDPNWETSKRFAVINADFNVLVYDFETGEVVKGHKGHENESRPLHNQQAHTAIEFFDTFIISSVNSTVIHYCLLTNTYKIFLDFSHRNPITIFKKSPKDSNLIAAGTKNGLVLLISLDKMEITARLRGHDTEITSLDWIYMSTAPEKQEKVSLENLIASTDTNDCFDIYADNTEPEFGVYRQETAEDGSDDEVNESEIQEKIVSNARFNFLEACSDLKNDIMTEDSVQGDTQKGKFEDNKDQYGAKNLENPSIDESMESNASSRTPVLTEESLNYLDECQRMKDFVIVSKDDVPQDIPVLASGSKEQLAWLWDINERAAITKIKWHPKNRPSLPTPFTNVLWMNQGCLLVTDGNGEINEYKILLEFPRKIKFFEEKSKKFDAKGVLNMCRSVDGTILWTSSIHRHISCLDVTNKFEKIVSLDTIQLRVHFIVENPIDSNVIAIGGNDKRLCLWNTSDAGNSTEETKRSLNSTIALRPFMNKIHSGILCLAWHPEKDNILAFSTREGRIGVLDVNKSTNVPVILAAFASQEVYSIAWAKIGDSMVLLACNGQKLVYYSQKEQWKMKSVDHLKGSSSVAVTGSRLAVGKNNGELSFVDMSKDFQVVSTKKICKKYIGMMTWYGERLAVASESGVTVLTEDSEPEKLEGHKGRVFSVRFNKAGDLLVSCCVTGYVKVWDLKSMSAVASFNIDTMAYTAIFLPSNEDFVVCGGQDSTAVIYAWKNQPKSEETATIKKKQHKGSNVTWAAPTEVTKISKNNQKRQKQKIVKVVDESLEELAGDVMKMNLQTKKSTSIFASANRELTSNPLEFIEKLLSGEQRDESINEKLFGSRESVKNFIESELSQNKPVKSNSVVILPQLADLLKTDILERIATKTLTEVHVAVAPSVSFDIWKKSCLAYAQQCVENEDSIAAVPYFLAVNDADTCISQLCDAKFFREAWIIAKMRKEDTDPILETIISKWTTFMDYTGNYESGAALLACKKNYVKAVELLEKRQNRTEKCEQILGLLLKKTENHEN